MDPNVPTNPSQLLPPNLLRGGQTSPGQIFQQNPLASEMSPNAMGADPSLMQQPPVGSQATDPTMGQPPQGTQPGQASLPGQPAPLSEAEMILKALSERLTHHSKVTERTISTLQKMVESGLPPDPNQASNGQ